MALLGLAYDIAGLVANGLVHVAPGSRGKVARSFQERRGLLERMERWARENREISRPLVWFHAPSFGEGLQARPVIELVKARRPDVQIAYTFFSPSAAAFAKKLWVDVADYLPFDTRQNAARMVLALRPNALIFSKLDVWPRLCETCVERSVPLGLISATMSAGAGRGGKLAHALLGDAYRSLSAVGAVSADDAERLARLGVRPECMTVTGDTRYDQVWTRANSPSPNAALVQSLRSARATLVAGSTWPGDETVLLPAWLSLRTVLPNARLILAPHEPQGRHTTGISDWARANGLSFDTVDGSAAARADVVVVDRVGILGDLYSLGNAGWVGGGFGTAGLHSVLEPAAFGLPVLFGPNYQKSRDAALLLTAGGGAAIKTVHDAAEVLARWLGARESAAAAGEKARSVVRQGLGAAERAYDLVMKLLKSA